MVLILIPSATDIIFFLTHVKLKAPSDLPDLSRNTLTNSPGSIRYLVARGSFDRHAHLIRASTTIVSIYALASLSASKISFWFSLVIVNPGNLSRNQNTKTGGTNPFKPIMSLIDLIAMRNIILSDSLCCSISRCQIFF